MAAAADAAEHICLGAAVAAALHGVGANAFGVAAAAAAAGGGATGRGEAAAKHEFERAHAGANPSNDPTNTGGRWHQVLLLGFATDEAELACPYLGAVADNGRPADAEHASHAPRAADGTSHAPRAADGASHARRASDGLRDDRGGSRSQPLGGGGGPWRPDPPGRSKEYATAPQRLHGTAANAVSPHSAEFGHHGAISTPGRSGAQGGAGARGAAAWFGLGAAAGTAAAAGAAAAGAAAGAAAAGAGGAAAVGFCWCTF